MAALVLLFLMLLQEGVMFGSGLKKPLTLMHGLPMTGSVWSGGKACLVPIEMALRHVNAREDLLTDYELKHVWKDSRCDAGYALNYMYEQLYTPPNKIMILGPGCSVEAEVTAQASHLWNITHISWASSSPVLSDKVRYPRFVRLAPPDTLSNTVKLAMMKLFNWRRVATINAAQTFFSAVIDDFVQGSKQHNITVITEEIFSPSHSPLSRVQNIKKQDARIIVAAAYEDAARKILCAAYQVELYGPKIVWMFPGWYRDHWWRKDLEDVSCTSEQMDKVAEGNFLFASYFYNTEEERGIANLTSNEFHRAVQSDSLYSDDIKAFEFISGNCYDSVWGAAIALDCADRKLKAMGHERTLDQCQYDDITMYDLITECTLNLSFTGVTGKVEFADNGDPIRNIKLDQIQGLERVHVGSYYMDSHTLSWHGNGVLWARSVPPRDSTLVINQEKMIPPYLYTVLCFFAGLGSTVAVSFLIFNIVQRDNAYVKLSSPNINNVLLLGCILTYSTVFMYSLQQREAIMCKVRTFTFTLGFSMAFGALFSKTWRVYRIFANKRLLRLKIKDSQLLGLVAGLLGVLSAVLIIREIVDPEFIVTTFLPKEVNMFGNDAEVHLFVRTCFSHYQSYFSWTIYIIEGVLMAFGAFLAFETRKVRIPALNDSRQIGMCLYNAVVLSVLGLTLSLVLKDQVALMYGILSSFVIMGTTTTQLIVFVPKVIGVYFPHRIDPEDQTVAGSRLGTSGSRRFEPRSATQNQRVIISTIKPSSSAIEE